jgi:hypothetical protein
MDAALKTFLKQGVCMEKINHVNNIEQQVDAARQSHRAVQCVAGQDIDYLKLRPNDMRRVHELQEANDKLQRMILQLDNDVKNSQDPLSLLAERERCFILIARNAGEILKYHHANELRLNRIAELEAETLKLKESVANRREQFVDTYDMNPRAKHAADFFLIKSKIEMNEKEIADLSKEI